MSNHLRVNAQADGEFLWKVEGAEGYKRHAIWLAPLPLPDGTKMTPWQIWRQGRVHVLLGASSTGHTRLRIQPR